LFGHVKILCIAISGYHHHNRRRCVKFLFDMFQQLQAGEFSVDEELACAMYEELIASAARAGLRQYEIARCLEISTGYIKADAGTVASDRRAVASSDTRGILEILQRSDGFDAGASPDARRGPRQRQRAWPWHGAVTNTSCRSERGAEHSRIDCGQW